MDESWRARVSGQRGHPVRRHLRNSLGSNWITKTRFTTLVVESVNRKPTDNVAGIEKMVPIVPAEFEVADLKPSAPDTLIKEDSSPAAGSTSRFFAQATRPGVPRSRRNQNPGGGAPAI